MLYVPIGPPPQMHRLRNREIECPGGITVLVCPHIPASAWRRFFDTPSPEAYLLRTLTWHRSARMALMSFSNLQVNTFGFIKIPESVLHQLRSKKLTLDRVLARHRQLLNGQQTSCSAGDPTSSIRLFLVSRLSGSSSWCHGSATFVLSTIGNQSVSGTARGALVLIIGNAAGLQNEIRYLNATAVMEI